MQIVKKYANRFLNFAYSRYLVVGGLAFIADYSVLLGLKAAGINTPVSAAAGFLTGFFISFYGNRGWTFGSGKDRKAHRQMLEYAALVLFNAAFTVASLTLLEEAIPIKYLKPIIVAMITIWNYLIYKKHIFRQEIKQSVAEAEDVEET